MSDTIVFRSGESLVASGPPGTAAAPEVIIGELDGPVGTALATFTGDQDWLLENQDSIRHKYYQMGLDGKI